MKRIFLFLVTNLAVMVVIGVIFNLLGLHSSLAANGVNLDLKRLLIMSAIIGSAGSIISLFMSKWSAKRGMGVIVIEQPQNQTEQWLVNVVAYQAQRAGIGMPEVGIFESPEPNAFATGASRDSALVAVSTGLLHHMSADEVEAVIGHEISHVANGDMITMALMQGVVNTFVYFFATIIGHFVDKVLLKNEESGYGWAYYVTQMVAQIALGILASMLTMWFSRYREFRADAGSSHLLGGPQPMMNALARLRTMQESHLPESVAAFGIAQSGGFFSLFATHPPLEERIAALQSQH